MNVTISKSPRKPFKNKIHLDEIWTYKIKVDVVIRSPDGLKTYIVSLEEITKDPHASKKRDLLKNDSYELLLQYNITSWDGIKPGMVRNFIKECINNV
jgi:hypothetical protein